MPRKTDSRERMIRTAARLFRAQGFSATGWRQVIAESETPWGSQAHHFPGGKEQLAADALTVAADQVTRALRAATRDVHPAEAVARWAVAAEAELRASRWADGCPVATVVLETAHTSDPLAAVGAAALAAWSSVLAEALAAQGVPAEEADSLSVLLLAAMEGALLLARAQRAAAPLQTVAAELGRTLRARVP